MPDNGDSVSVAAAVVHDGNRILVSERHHNDAFAGQWEFPGGKQESGESLNETLARELFEELHIRVHEALPLIRVSHCYPSRTVNLHVFEVLRFSGVARGCEGQAIQWVVRDQLDTLDFLEANGPIVRAAQLPRLCLITDVNRFGIDATLKRLEKHVRSRRCIVLIREGLLPPDMLRAFAGEVVRVCEGHDTLVFNHASNQELDVPGIQGLHLPASALHKGWNPDHRPRFLGVSCHDRWELDAAHRLGADYAFLSPVKPTASHPNAGPLGWDGFSRLSIDAGMPVYALGGLGLRELPEAATSGAQGIAAITDAWC